MSITIKQIAELCGTSRGTVDRVLNNRGKVNKRVEEKINRIVELYGYKPNFAARGLVIRKKSLVIGVLTISEGNVFFDDVFRGIKQAENELLTYGVTIVIKTMKGYDVTKQIVLIDELMPEINALILTPIDDSKIAQKIEELIKMGIAVFTLNNDIVSSRLCYIGSNYFNGGETACGMMSIVTRKHAVIGIVTGSNKVLGHRQRIKGFEHAIQTQYPGMIIRSIIEAEDDEIQAYELTKQMLSQHRDIDSIYVVAGGVYGVCRAIIACELGNKINVISFDKTPSSIEMLKKGLIKALICQQPFTQGYRSIIFAFQYLANKTLPENGQYIVKNEIKIIENL